MASLPCPAPFLDSRHFPNTGYVAGRFCGVPGSLTAHCCLPCPISPWIFEDSFLTTRKQLRYISPISLAACVFLLLSWLVLPTDKSHRHYLNVGLVACILILDVALTIPIGGEVPECANGITPTDMHTTHACGWEGALFMFGGMGVVIWILLRVIWHHIRVFWNTTPGKWVVWLSTAAGIAIPAIFLGVTLGVSGFAYRAATQCFVINGEGGFIVMGFWIGFAGLALVLQLVTTGYCVIVFLSSHRLRTGHIKAARRSMSWQTLRFWKREPRPEGDGFHHPHKRWRGIRHTVSMQRRIILLTVALVIEVVFFTAIFWASEERVKSRSNPSNPQTQEFAACLVYSGGNRELCLPYAQYLVLSKNSILGAFGMFSLAGVQAFAFLFRSSMLVAWWELAKKPREIIRTYKYSKAFKLPQVQKEQPLPAHTIPSKSFFRARARKSSSKVVSPRKSTISAPIPITPPRQKSNRSSSQLTTPEPKRPPHRPRRPQTPPYFGYRVSPPPPPLPLHLAASGFAEPERRDVWEGQMAGSGEVPVLDLTASPKGGLGLHPVVRRERSKDSRGDELVDLGTMLRSCGPEDQDRESGIFG